MEEKKAYFLNVGSVLIGGFDVKFPIDATTGEPYFEVVKLKDMNFAVRDPKSETGKTEVAKLRDQLISFVRRHEVK